MKRPGKNNPDASFLLKWPSGNMQVQFYNCGKSTQGGRNSDTHNNPLRLKFLNPTPLSSAAAKFSGMLLGPLPIEPTVQLEMLDMWQFVKKEERKMYLSNKVLFYSLSRLTFRVL